MTGRSAGRRPEAALDPKPTFTFAALTACIGREQNGLFRPCIGDTRMSICGRDVRDDRRLRDGAQIQRLDLRREPPVPFIWSVSRSFR